MALVFSYVRYSTRKQMKGDSLRRQMELGERWITENNHTLATRTIHDLGVSAFKGRNRHKGALSRFLADVGTRIPQGSILLVENLDRLSREGMDEAGDLFKQIIKAGVDIATMMPTAKVYTRESLKDPIGILEPLLYFHNAYLESKKKSERISEKWKEKRKLIAQGKIVDAVRPSWLDFDKKTRSFRLNKGAAAVKLIFERTAEGIGQRQIVRELQTDFAPIGRSKKWNSSFVQKVLSDRAVLGERQCYVFTEEGERVKTGSPVARYYPPAIEEPLWFRAQGKKRDNLRKKGRNTQFINLFTGLLTDINDGCPMHIQAARLPSGKTQRRLVSYGHVRSMPGSDFVSVDYTEFERQALYALSEIFPDDLVSKPSISLVAEVEQEIRGVVDTITATQKDLTDPKNLKIRSLLLDSLNSLEERRQTLQDRLDILQASRHSDHALREVHSIDRMLREVTGDDLRTLRLKLRSAISDVVESIVVKPEKHYGRVFALAQIRFRGTPWTKRFFVGIKGARASISDRIPLVIDKRHQYFAEIARQAMQPAEMPEFKTVPDSLKEAADLWLSIRRAEMGKSSFRVVPAKIVRFLTVVGDEGIDANRWELWVRTLRLEIREGKLQRQTARVGYCRSREFVRWLISHNKAAPIPGLEKSAEKALG